MTDPKNPLEIRQIDENDEEWKLVKALTTHIAAIASEFNLTHTLSALTDLLGYCLTEVKPEFRDRTQEQIFKLIAEHRKYHEEKDVTVIDEGKKGDDDGTK